MVAALIPLRRAPVQPVSPRMFTAQREGDPERQPIYGWRTR